MSATEDRRAQVLRAIVADYISSQEPVGSKTLVDRHNLGVSSATIRNDMAVLEDEGFITQPHTSSGRVPTEKGYRHFVDSIEEGFLVLPDSSDLAPLQRALDSLATKAAARAQAGWARCCRCSGARFWPWWWWRSG